jgi:hypothetical protein
MLALTAIDGHLDDATSDDPCKKGQASPPPKNPPSAASLALPGALAPLPRVPAPGSKPAGTSFWPCQEASPSSTFFLVTFRHFPPHSRHFFSRHFSRHFFLVDIFRHFLVDIFSRHFFFHHPPGPLSHQHPSCGRRGSRPSGSTEARHVLMSGVEWLSLCALLC